MKVSLPHLPHLPPLPIPQKPTHPTTVTAPPVVAPTVAFNAKRFETELSKRKNLADKDTQLESANSLLSHAAKSRDFQFKLMSSQDKNLQQNAQSLRDEAKRSPLSLKQLLKLNGKNPAQVFLLLRGALKQEKDADETHQDSHTYESLTGLLKDLQRQYGRLIRASITAKKSRVQRNGTRKKTGDVRDIYYSNIASTQSVFGLISVLLEQENSEDNFRPMLGELRHVIADDLAALKPSSPNLRPLMEGLQISRYVSGTLTSCEYLLGRFRSKNPTLKLAAPVFMQHLLALASKGLVTKDLQQLAVHIGGSKIQHQLAFLNNLRPMLKDLPRVLWPDTETRMKGFDNLWDLGAKLTEQELAAQSAELH